VLAISELVTTADGGKLKDLNALVIEHYLVPAELLYVDGE
jgi:hypothetical protein